MRYRLGVAVLTLSLSQRHKSYFFFAEHSMLALIYTLDFLRPEQKGRIKTAKGAKSSQDR